MLKYLLPFFFLLSSCSMDTESRNLTIEENNKYTIYNILWSFEIDYEKDTITKPLIIIQDICYKNNFLDYRNCFLKELRSQYDVIISNSQQEKFFQIFSESLEKEIAYYPYYQELGKMWYPERDVYLDPDDCFTVGSGSFRTEYAGTLSESSIPIQLSYVTSDRENLTRAFPLWKDIPKYDSTSFTGSHFDPNHPCLYRTFWPSYGNIIFTKIVWDDLFIFIKVNEWAWSGEFDYSVFIYDMIAKNYIHIGSFWAWRGIVPFPYNLNLEIEKNSPIDLYEKHPFLYLSITANRRIYWDTVESIFRQYIQK
jgi:hypothetical protein